MSGSAGGDDAVGARGGPPPGGPVRAGGRIVAALSRGADRVFGLTAAGTTPSREVVAGVTTFLAMAYILFVNPRSEEHTSELQSRENLVCRLLHEEKNL